MPELPEVETVRRQLARVIKGKRIVGVRVLYPKAVRPMSAAAFARAVKGAKISKIDRRAKLLLIQLSNGYTLVTHFKMTGHLFLKDKKEKFTSATEIIFSLANGQQLFYDDFRRFGFIRAVHTKDLQKYFGREGFGPEALSPKLTLKKFKDLLGQKPRAKIKPLLMDQKFVAGLGNIYAQEACFCAKIRPTRIVASLGELEIKNLYNCFRKVLREAIRCHGTSSDAYDAYTDLKNKKGSYAARLKVYDRAGQPCRFCQTKIKKMVLAGRGTAYCSQCQK